MLGKGILSPDLLVAITFPKMLADTFSYPKRPSQNKRRYFSDVEKKVVAL